MERFPDMQMTGCGWHPYRCAGIVEDGVLKGAFVLGNYRIFDAEATCYFETPRCASKQVITECFTECFERIGLKRLTARTATDNKRMRRFLEGVGFTHEGTLRRALDGERDAEVYSILKEEWQDADTFTA